MKKLSCLLLLLTVIVCSCGIKDSLPGDNRGRIELQEFIPFEVKRWGGLDKTAALPPTKMQIDYRYTRDADGCQVYCKGDRSAELQSYLRSLYGPPSLVSTNKDGYVFAQYGFKDIGLALQCVVAGEELGDTNKLITHIVIVRSGAL